jgi:hypothetical protein
MKGTKQHQHMMKIEDPCPSIFFEDSSHNNSLSTLNITLNIYLGTLVGVSSLCGCAMLKEEVSTICNMCVTRVSGVELRSTTWVRIGLRFQLYMIVICNMVFVIHGVCVKCSNKSQPLISYISNVAFLFSIIAKAWLFQNEEFKI